MVAVTKSGQHKVIFLNGPPECGKDTAATVITQRSGLNIQHKKFASLVKQIARVAFGLPDALFVELERSGNNAMKNVPQICLGGLSWREACIMVSEKWIKPSLGEQFFGNRLAQVIAERSNFFVGTAISDSGFDQETIPVVKRFGKDNCYLLRIHRPNKTFDGDSRTYLSGEAFHDSHVFDIHNNHDEALFRAMILRRTDKIFGVEGRDYTIG